MERISREQGRILRGIHAFNRKVTPELLEVLGFDPPIEGRDFYFDRWVTSSSIVTIGLFFDDADVFYTPNIFDAKSDNDKAIRDVVLKDTRHIVEIFESFTNKKFRLFKKRL